MRLLRLVGRQGWITRLPLAGGWTKYRDLPQPAGRTFMELHRAEQTRKHRRQEGRQ